MNAGRVGIVGRLSLAGLVVLAALTQAKPARADFKPSISHIWSHIRAAADLRYERLAGFRTQRGTYVLTKYSAAQLEFLAAGISFSPALPSAPIAHVVGLGEAAPAECPGTVALPEAAPGHFCLYEGVRQNAANLTVVDPSELAGPTVAPYGTTIWVQAQGAGYMQTRGSWAVTRP